ncbi:unnamed protein product [Paramecium octaurelia]|uniref:Uncharacterized protein n=1 Tax=Paramecium octaurelia TaxID=43137 RepID=A0A8S1WBZ4_PAROT|nr:unnamed protein product [Paramecium octaurelia]
MKSRELETKNETKDHLLIFCSDPIAGLGLQLSSLQRSLLYIISSAIYASKTNTNSRTFYQNHRLITQIQMTHQGVSHYNYKLIQNIQCSSQRTPVGSRVRHPLNHPALLTPGNQLFKNVKQTNTKNELIHIYDAKLNRKIQSNPQIKIISQLSEIIDLLMVIPAQFFDSQIRGWYLHRVFPSPYRRNTNGFPKLPTAGIRKSIRLWDVKTGQQKAKLDGHSETVNSICYSPDGTTLASGSDDNHIRLWDIKTGQQILSSDNCCQDIVAQFSSQNFNNNLIQESGIYFLLYIVNSPVNYLVISNQLEFRSNGVLILKGEFINQSGIDLRTLFKQRGSFILENQIGLQKR